MPSKLRPQKLQRGQQPYHQPPKSREAWLDRFCLDLPSADPEEGVFYARVKIPISSEDSPPVATLGQLSPKKRRMKLAAERGQIEAMYQWALECGDRAERIRWLTLAAERGYVPAMHDLGLACGALHERRRWLMRAAQRGWAESAAELGDVECS